MRLQEMGLTKAATVLLAVGDGVLADSMRFALELEGFEVKLCDEYTLPRAIGVHAPHACVVLDQAVFGRLTGPGRGFSDCDTPVVLLAGLKSEPILARATASGVTKVLETPLAGEALSDAIKAALEACAPSRARHRPS